MPVTLSVMDYVAMSGYLVLMVAAAVAWRRSSHFNEYSLAARQLPPVLMFASITATIIGPGFSIGVTDEGAAKGVLSLALFLPYAVQTWLVAMFLAPKLAAVKGCSSIGDVLGRLYDRKAQALAGLSTLTITVMVAAYLAKVAGDVVHDVTGLPASYGAWGITALAASHSVFGGLRATVLTDTVQFCIFAIVIPLVAIGAFASPSFSSQTAVFAAQDATAAAWKAMPLPAVIGTALSFLVGETLLPPYAARALASSSPQASGRAFMWSAIFCAAWLVCLTSIGVASGQVLGQRAQVGGTLIAMGEHVLPRGIFGLMLVALVSVIMSSQDAVLNSGAVAAVRDLVVTNMRVDDRAQVRLAKIVAVVISVSAAVVASSLPGIIATLLLIYSIWAPTILVPLVVGLLVRETGRQAAWLSILGGGLVSVTWQVWFEMRTGVPAILPGLIASGVAYAVGNKLSRERSSLRSLC